VTLDLTIVGSASAEPNPGGASSCYLLDAGEGQLVLECGHGAAAKLLLHTSIDRIKAILISHMHPDHFFDIVPLKYYITFNGLPRLPLYVPPTGPAILEGMIRALDEKDEFWGSAYDIRVFDPDQELCLLGMRIRMAPTHHFIPAWAMRFSSLNGTASGAIGYTSDTSVVEPVVELVRGTDVLLAECSVVTQAKSERDQGHLTPEQAAELARRAHARRLLLTHYPSAHADSMVRHAAQAFDGPCSLAVEGATYRV